MKTRRLLVTMILSLVLVFALMSTALAAFCINCGTSLPDGANFCSNCGQRVGEAPLNPNTTVTTDAQPKPAPSSLSITKVKNNDNGRVDVTWSDSGDKGPYTVRYMMMHMDDFNEDFSSAKFVFTEAEDVTDNTYEMVELVPGVDYWIIIEDAQGNRAYKAYKPGTAPRFLDFQIKLSIDLKYRRNNAYSEVYSFSASDYGRYKDSTTYGAYILLDYSRLARERQYMGLIAITDPKGEVHTNEVTDITLPRGYYSLYWPFYDLNTIMGDIYEGYGKLPSGNYTFSLYFDGMFVTSQTFRVGQ